jgi:hypothetical protein
MLASLPCGMRASIIRQSKNSPVPQEEITFLREAKVIWEIFSVNIRRWSAPYVPETIKH